MADLTELPPTRRAWLSTQAAGRAAWRQLTSMRTALVLLFLLALAAIPGSILPQYAVKREDVANYYRAHPDLAPVLERLYGFDVYASPWFAAIYLLLFTSLVGCVLPRLRDHYRAMRAQPPQAPRQLDRMPQYTRLDQVSPDAVPAALRGWRQVRRELPDGTVTVSAEKGHLKETGNLLFHFALLAVLIGMGYGAVGGWHAGRLLVAGKSEGFCNTVQQFDDFGLGAWVQPDELPAFCLQLDEFIADYRDDGMPASFEAKVQVNEDATRNDVYRPARFAVNDPLRLDGANVYLLGHGYAPVLRYTDAQGVSQEVVRPFLIANPGTLTSNGVAAFPDANSGDPTKQIGFQGRYLPTIETAPGEQAGPFVAQSTFPAERAPGLFLMAYRGDLGMDGGLPNSVYELNKRNIDNGKLKRYGTSQLLRIGDSWTLEDGSRIEFLGTRSWITISIRHDPGTFMVLGGIVAMLIGLPLSLYGRRRRVWLRLHPDGSAEAAGLPRTDYPGFADEFGAIVERWRR